MLLSAVSVLVVAQSSSEIPEGLMNNPVYVLDKEHSDASYNRTSISPVNTISKMFSTDSFPTYAT